MSSSESKRAMHCESIALVLIKDLNDLVVYNKELKLR
jgi:hypothetical protein